MVRGAAWHYGTADKGLHLCCPLQAEHHCSAAELEMQHCRARSAALRKQVAELQANNRALKHKILAESSWGSSTALVKVLSNGS